jgi:CshA-type fibril repeat protein
VIPSSSVLSNYTDPEGDSLHLESVTAGIGGTVSLSLDQQSITFIPALNFSGAAKFTYLVSDGNGGSTSGEVNVTVTPVNDTPVLKPNPPSSSGTTEEDKSLVIASSTLLANFTDPDTGDSLSLDSVSNPKNGMVARNNGSVTFTPNANFVGEAAFDYTVKDSQGATSKATFKVTVTPANDPPVLKPSAPNTSGSTEEDKAFTLPAATLLANFSDADTEDELTLEGVTNPKNGTVTFANGIVTFTPSADFVGEASFDYIVKDSKGATATATFKVNVTPANDPPVLKPSAPNTGGSTEEDKALSLPVATLLANFSDADTEDELTLEGVTNPKNGSVTLVNGVITFTPDTNFVGEASFYYTVKDSKGATATATFKVNVTPANDPPVLKPSAPNTGGSTEEDKALSLPVATLLANFSDADTEDELTLEGVTNPKNGTVTFANGIVTFTPSADFVGEASFDYTVKDSKGATATATFKVTVTEVADQLLIKGNGSSISNGASSTTTTNLSSFGDVQVTKTLAHTFTIENPNTLEVQLVSVSFKDTTTQSSHLVPTLYQLGGIQNLEAAGAGDFFLINTNLPLTIAKQSSAAFDISFAPSTVGLREADVSLSFSNGSTFSFRVSGSGVAIVEPPNNIPIFNPLGLFLLLIGLLWLGRKRFS